jgi:hypothetical protein
MNSHFPMLNIVCAALAFPKFKVKKTLELGCGEYSTPFFIEHSENHTAIETTGHEHEARSVEWYERIKSKYGNRITIELHDFNLSINAMKAADADLIFVDGATRRPEFVNAAFLYTTTVLAHDTEESGYGWEQVVVPFGWQQFTRGSDIIPDPLNAWTTCWTKDIRLAAVLSAIGLTEKTIPRKG